MIPQLFEYYNYAVSIRVNENPDMDFLIMCIAKYFVQSGGRYSEIADKFVKHLGGDR